MAKLSDTHYSYTQSFLHQLQTEWKEFWLEVGQSEPNEITPSNVDKINEKQGLRENLVESLNKFNSTVDDNIVIPVPLKALKRLFSPSKCNADDEFKIEFLNEIKENLNLTTITCKKLQRLLLSESTLEVSDFPTPSILENYRKSAPARLLNKKKIKSRQLFDKNDLFKLADNLKNTENQIVPKINRPKENNKKEKLNRLVRNIIDSSDEGDDKNVPRNNMPNDRNNLQNDRDIPRNNFQGDDNIPRNVLQNVDKNIPTPAKSTNKPKNVDRRKLLSVKKTKRTNLRECQVETNADKRYSSVYDLKLDSRESSTLFVTGRSQKKTSKSTIVCTYFSQDELANIYQIVKKLGFFEIENNVSSRTTHLICGSSKKTVNLCKAVARGSWILEKEWIFSSSSEGRWLYEERFEKYDLSPAVKENRLKRQKYGPVYRCNIFTQCGPMYVSKNCGRPKTEDIKELIILGGGHITDSTEKAKYIVGYLPQRECLKETWVLSCIMQGQVLDITKHFKII